MVVSLINNSIFYDEDSRIYKDDINHEASLYEIQVDDVDIDIVLGKQKNEYIENEPSIIYFPIYLAYKDLESLYKENISTTNDLMDMGLRSKIDFYRRISRTAVHTHVDDLETEIEDRFGPLPVAFRRLLDLARLRITASSLSIDSISKQPGLLVIGHHNIHCIEKWRQRCVLSGQEVRVVGNKTVVLPLQDRVAADADKLFQAVKTLFQIG